MLDDVYIYPYTGLGDSIYQRPFVRAMADRHRYVYYRTPWPELVSDFKNVRPVKPDMDWRTQARNISYQDDRVWHTVPDHLKRDFVRVGYDVIDLQQRPVTHTLEKQMPLKDTPFIFDLPAEYTKCPIDSKGKPIALVRPPTLRREWYVPARNTLPEYVDYCADVLRRKGYHVVSVADTKPEVEWLVGKVRCHEAFHKGELKIKELIGLVRSASIVVGNSGWIIPMSIAAKTPLFVIWGGRGMFDSQRTVMDTRMDLSKVGWAYPDHFCLCGEDEHDCDKRISNLPNKFDLFLEKINGKRTTEQAA